MGSGPRFEATPSWRLATVLFVIVLVSYAVEHFLHWLQHRLQHGGKAMNQLLAKGYVTALTKLKEELMLLGFISMFLAFTEDYFALLCMPASWMDPSKDTFVAANHADDKQCVATMYHKPGYVKSTADDHRRLMGNDMSTAQRALQWATESGASEQVQSFLASACESSGASLVEGRRQLGGGGGGDDNTCIGSGLEEFVSLAALHQAHILIFLIAVFHITYTVLTMMMSQRVVATLDDLEVWGDGEDESVDALHKPRSGWPAAFIRQIYNLGFRNPFTYMSLRNFFIIKHGLSADFPFDDYIALTAAHEFENIIGLKWWMWLCLTLYVLAEGLGFHYFTGCWSLASVFISMLVGTKVSKIACDVAIDSYEQYDKNGDGKLSQDELEHMQKLHKDSAASVKKSHLTGDQNFWLGRPQFLGGLLQYTMFQNSMVFSIALFHSWQVKGNCYMGKDLRIYRVVLGLLLLAHDSLITFPTYIVVVQMGDTYSKTLLKSTKQLIVKGVVEKSHVNLIDDTQNTSTNDAGTKEKPRATTPPPSTRKRPSTPPKRSPAVEPASSSPKVAPARKAAVKAAAVEDDLISPPPREDASAAKPPPLDFARVSNGSPVRK